MAFISKEDPVVLNIMLTSKGRERLSTGNLTFKYFAVGDSEIDYNFIREINSDSDVAEFTPFDSSILRPKDKNPKIISYIPRVTTGSSFNDIDTISAMPYSVVNAVDSLGYFIETSTGATYIIESTHIKQPDAMVYMNTITGGTVLNLRKAPAYGNSVLEPSVGDYVYVKWTLNTNTTGFTVNKNFPVSNLVYKIVSKTGTLAANTLSVVVDRNLPDLNGYGATGKAGAMIFYSGITEAFPFPTDYLSESVLDFIQNYECGIAKFPFWNMSIIFTEEIAGIQAGDRKYGQFKNRSYGGFVSYIQNQVPYYKKLGIIHYTNDSPANTYGEELYLKTPSLSIPTVMWHKSSGNTMGLTLIATGSSKLLSGDTKSLNIEYYDLADASSGYIVGKVFNGLKLFVIEDQELLYAMSYKSNRSWTLPNYLLGTAGTNPCPPTATPPSAPIMHSLGLYIDICDSMYVSWSVPIGGLAPYNYYLYRKINDGAWTLYKNELTEPNYLEEGLTNGLTYYYKVVAGDQNHLLSNESNIVSHKVNCTVPPTTPYLNPIAIGDECNMFEVTWTASETNTPPITYVLYRKDSVNPSWIILDDQITALYYMDDNFGSGLIDGRTYYYKVVAIDNDHIQSNASNIQIRTVNCVPVVEMTPILPVEPESTCASMPINVNLNTFNCMGNDGGEYSIKMTCISYSMPMDTQDYYCLHLNNYLCVDSSQIGNGSFACVSIKSNSIPIASSCLSSGNTYQVFNTSFMVCAGQTIEIYNQAFTSDINCNGNAISCTRISEIEKVHGNYEIGSDCQNVCVYTG